MNETKIEKGFLDFWFKAHQIPSADLMSFRAGVSWLIECVDKEPLDSFAEPEDRQDIVDFLKDLCEGNK